MTTTDTATEVAYYTEETGTPDSSVIKTIYYDSQTWSLYVKFHSGRIAAYKDVPPAVHRDFKNANSVGSFYNSRIKFRYNGINGDVQLQWRNPGVVTAANLALSADKVREADCVLNLTNDGGTITETNEQEFVLTIQSEIAVSAQNLGEAVALAVDEGLTVLEARRA